MVSTRTSAGATVKKTRKALGDPVEEIAVRKSPRTHKVVKSAVPVEKPKISVPASKNGPPSFSYRKGVATEADIIGSKQTGQLMGYINSLMNSDQERIFSSYKKEASVQMEKDAELILQLVEEAQDKDNVIEELQKELQAYREGGVKPEKNATATPLKSAKKPDLLYESASTGVYESPIKRKKNSKLNEPALINKDDISQELKTIGITLDMLELLTGLRIVDYDEDRTKFHFDVKQASTVSAEDGAAADVKVITIQYQLVISKKFESTAEVKYVPTFLNHLDASGPQPNADEGLRLTAAKLNKYLPDYFCDNLTFPYNTLSQFYIKMNKALNKIAKKK